MKPNLPYTTGNKLHVNLEKAKEPEIKLPANIGS